MIDNIKTYPLSIKGRREGNEDSWLIFNPSKNSLFIAVADGMGGVVGGKEASSCVIESCKTILTEKFKTDVKPSELKQILIHVFQQAQSSIRGKLKTQPQLTGMGTTLACILILDEYFVWGNLGDSRIYYFTKSKLHLVTTDHTHIQEFREKNKEPLSQTIINNYSNFLTRSIDGGKDEPDIYPDVLEYEKLNDGDAFIVCSDGLITDKTEANENIFEKYLIGTKDIEEAGNKLVKMASDNGSSDNITVVLFEKGRIKRKKINFTLTETRKSKEAELKHKTLKKNRYNRISKTIAGLSVIILALIIFIIADRPSKSDLEVSLLNHNSNEDNNKSIVNKSDSISPIELPGSNIENKDQSDLNNVAEENKDEIIRGKNEKEKLIKIPLLKGKSETEAIKILKDIGLEYKIDTVKGVGKSDIGMVKNQIPKAPKEVPKGTTITIFVKYPSN